MGELATREIWRGEEMVAKCLVLDLSRKLVYNFSNKIYFNERLLIRNPNMALIMVFISEMLRE